MANPLDTDAGTELFKHYETEYQLVQADLVQKLDQIAELSGEPRKAALSAAERALEETGELLDQMQMEKQNVPSAQRAAINRRLRDYKTDVDGYRRKLRTLADDRSALFGARYTDDPGSSSGDAHFEQRQQLLAGAFTCRSHGALGRRGANSIAGTDRLDRSTQRLKASQALANETEAIGASTLAQLQQQRETIIHTTNVLYESEGYVDRSIKSLKGIARRYDVLWYPGESPSTSADTALGWLPIG
jgi:vesicle transport through interaction with t-SNAREs protein 1